MFWSKPKKLLFEHVPKCGGNSIRAFLKQSYSSEKSFLLNGGSPHSSIESFKDLPKPQRHSFQFVFGHGAHRLRRHCDPEMLAATILRDPIDRIVSHYYFVAASPDHYLYEQLTAEEMTLAEYARSNISGELTNNYACRFLEIDNEEAMLSPQATVDRAFDLLSNDYSIVGTLENLDESMMAIKKMFRLRKRWVNQKLNVTKQRKSKSEISDEERQAIQESNSIDIELYRRVLAISPK
ncbi:hypothetical protein FHS27_002089 [Rhodopirellula rubra]|uniref:Sulfotransferase family protein n=1 Tax=Aporhodopirellula rubra TaxID=980271 RepID=A0A7W5DXC6_9BACT|nr:sulfotransferase family 2 domain-containing protein [Aporhodopirellula rubra]MBB3206280.1 hypothetical protein [Aporhodopirellula rubra]